MLHCQNWILFTCLILLARSRCANASPAARYNGFCRFVSFRSTDRSTVFSFMKCRNVCVLISWGIIYIYNIQLYKIYIFYNIYRH